MSTDNAGAVRKLYVRDWPLELKHVPANEEWYEVVLATDYDVLSQQLAELQRDLAVTNKLYEESCNAAYARGALEQQLAEMRRACDHVYRDSMLNEGGMISHEAISKCAAISRASTLAASIASSGREEAEKWDGNGKPPSELRYFTAAEPPKTQGKCETCGGTRKVSREQWAVGTLVVVQDPCPKCSGDSTARAPAAEQWTVRPTTPEERAKLPRRCYCGNYHCAGDCGPEEDGLAAEPAAEREGVIEGLRAARDRLAVRSYKAEAASVDRAIALLQSKP